MRDALSGKGSAFDVEGTETNIYYYSESLMNDVMGGAYGLQGFVLYRGGGYNSYDQTIEELTNEHKTGNTMFDTSYPSQELESTLSLGWRYVALVANRGSWTCLHIRLYGKRLPDSWINPQVDPQFCSYTSLNIGVQPDSEGKNDCPIPREGANYPTEYITYKIYDLEADL